MLNYWLGMKRARRGASQRGAIDLGGRVPNLDANLPFCASRGPDRPAAGTLRVNDALWRYRADDRRGRIDTFTVQRRCIFGAQCGVGHRYVGRRIGTSDDSSIESLVSQPEFSIPRQSISKMDLHGAVVAHRGTSSEFPRFIRHHRLIVGDDCRDQSLAVRGGFDARRLRRRDLLRIRRNAHCLLQAQLIQ